MTSPYRKFNLVQLTLIIVLTHGAQCSDPEKRRNLYANLFMDLFSLLSLVPFPFGSIQFVGNLGKDGRLHLVYGHEKQTDKKVKWVLARWAGIECPRGINTKRTNDGNESVLFRAKV